MSEPWGDSDLADFFGRVRLCDTLPKLFALEAEWGKGRASLRPGVVRDAIDARVKAALVGRASDLLFQVERNASFAAARAKT